jgi:hypothetical protein
VCVVCLLIEWRPGDREVLLLGRVMAVILCFPCERRELPTLPPAPMIAMFLT